MTDSAAILPGIPAAEEWPPLAEGSSIPMQTHAWMSARAGLLVGSGLQVVAVGDAGRVKALAPLYRAGKWLRELPVLFEPSDFIWGDEGALQTLAEAVVGLRMPLYLERLPEDSPTLPALRKAIAGRGLVTTRPAMPTPFIALDGRGADTCLNAGRRSDLRRAERRAAGFGQVSYEIHAPASEDDLDRLLDEAFGIETRSWKYAARTALTADAGQGAFFIHFMDAAYRLGHLRIAFLRIDGKPVAMQIASEWQQRFWLFKMSYDEAYARCSPGQLLLRHTLEHAAGRGLRSYEFMGVMDEWTKLWTRDVRRYVQVRVIPFSAAAARMAVRSGLRAVVHRLRRLMG